MEVPRTEPVELKVGDISPPPAEVVEAVTELAAYGRELAELPEELQGLTVLELMDLAWLKEHTDFFAETGETR